MQPKLTLAAVAALLLLVPAARLGRDDMTDKLAALTQRVQRLEDALGATTRDVTNEPLVRRLERVEEALKRMRADTPKPATPRLDLKTQRDVESIRRAQQDMQRVLDRVQRALTDARGGGAGDTHRLESQLSGLQRSLNALESRVSRLERG